MVGSSVPPGLGAWRLAGKNPELARESSVGDHVVFGGRVQLRCKDILEECSSGSGEPLEKSGKSDA